MNVVMLIGRVGKDPESFDYSNDQGAQKGCHFSLATSTKSKGEEKTEWHRVTAFGKTAEFILSYIGKGRLLSIEGRIQYGNYEKDGITRYTPALIANRVQALDKSPVAQSGGTVNSVAQSFPDDADDVPF